MPPTNADASVPSFADLGLPETLVRVLQKKGIVTPLPIQAATIRDALAGRDVAGKAPTGSGKTLAFSLPMAASIGSGAPRRPRGLVLAPTRELAAQIAGELKGLLAVQHRTVHAIYGGVGFGPQRQALRKGVDVVVACPGRLEDLLAQGDLKLAGVDVVVVDEADRMADMGFLPAVRRILEQTSQERQTLLFSATLDGAVDVLVRSYQRDPVRHEIEPLEGDRPLVTHRFHEVGQSGRVALCAELLRDRESAVVFVRTKHGADRVARLLAEAGVAAAAIHGGHSQAQRERTLAKFRAGRCRALVATDVVARGIHVDGVACVIHYDLPPDPKDYVHRSGRTGRAGSLGVVDAFVTPDTRATAVSLARELDLEIEANASLLTPPPSRSAGPGRRPSGQVRRQNRGPRDANAGSSRPPRSGHARRRPRDRRSSGPAAKR
jgi:superfamily II DNA/RNA helicase